MPEVNCFDPPSQRGDPSLALTAAQVAAAQAMVSGAGDLRTGYELFPANAPVAVNSGTTGFSTATVIIDGESWLAVTCQGGTSSNFELQWHSLSANFAGDAAVVEVRYDPAHVASVNFFAAESSAYSIYGLGVFNTIAASTTQPYSNTGSQAICFSTQDWAKTGYTRGTEEEIWAACKLRISVANGVSGTFYLKRLSVGTERKFGRLCVTIDDGYASAHRIALPVFESYGIPVTLGIIPSLIGTAGFMTKAQLQDAKARGHQIVPHGPDTGVGNLFSRWPTDAQALADVTSTRDWISANGLDSVDGAASSCYIWPQGQYTRTAGDPTFLGSMLSAGFRVGRSASPAGVGYYMQGASISARLHGRLTQATIGHTYAGATNTPDDATETANISTIVSRVGLLSSQRKDAFLMLHDFARRGGAPAGGLYIEMDRLQTICAAIKTGMDAGTLQTVKMSALIQ
jgi:hypothetical protein